MEATYCCRLLGRDSVIRRIKHLEPKPALLHRQIADLPQVARIDVAPRVAFPAHGLANVLREVSLILVRLDDIPDSQRVNIIAVPPRARTNSCVDRDFLVHSSLLNCNTYSMAYFHGKFGVYIVNYL